jgi:hypothetical protein
VLRHRVEIAVVVEQRRAILDAPGADQKVDRLAHRNAEPAQGTKITGGKDRIAIPGHRHDVEAAQQRFDFARCPLAGETLQNLAQHQIANNDLIRSEDWTQRADVGRAAPIEEVNPDAAVDNNHFERSLNSSAFATAVEVSAPAKFAESRANIPLSPQLDHQTQRILDGLLFGRLAGGFLSFRHKRVIDLDIGAH